MSCARCPSPTPITVLRGGVELCRVCADLPREGDRDVKPENVPHRAAGGMP